MSVKLDKLGAERDKALRKRNDWDARYKELDRQYKELENCEIHDIVHQFKLNPEQLAQLLGSLHHQLPNPEIPSEIVNSTATTDTTTMEDKEDEA